MISIYNIFKILFYYILNFLYFRYMNTNKIYLIYICIILKYIYLNINI